MVLPPEPEPIWPAAIAQKPPRNDPNIKLREELAKLESARQAWLDLLQKKEQNAAKLKQQVGGLTETLKKINSQIETVTKQRAKDRETQLQLELAKNRILGQIAKVDRDIEEAQKRSIGAPTKFQVVPFDGHTGTNYRPILIECTAAGMRFLPENVLLKHDDFDGFTVGKNPLLGRGARPCRIIG